MQQGQQSPTADESAVVIDLTNNTTAIDITDPTQPWRAPGGWRYKGWRLLVKRLVDLVVATVAGILVLPILAVVALVVKVSTPGPVLFRQARIGQHGERFDIWKFRTMYSDAEAVLSSDPELYSEYATNHFKLHLEADPRITQVGRFLRRSSLDELPQIWNVLRGDMTLVGPRPVVPAELSSYGPYESAYTAVRPGMTGEWQVLGRDEIGYPERARLDAHYVSNWSLHHDLGLLLRTPLALLSFSRSAATIAPVAADAESPLRVALVFSRSDSVGGASIYTEIIASELRRRGHSVLILVGGEGPFIDRLNEAGLPWRPIPGFGRTTSVTKNATALRNLRRELEEFEPTLVAAQGANAGLLCRMLRRRIDVPVVYTPHGWAFAPGMPRLERTLSLLCERLVRRNTDALLAVSAFDRDLGVDSRVISADKVTVVHNGIPYAPELPARADDGQPCEIVMVARFERQKDHETLIRSMARISSLPWRLNLVGDGPLFDDMQRLAGELGIADRIEWSGYRSDIDDVLAKSDVFVLSTHSESLPLSIIEAMRAGLPVIASNVGGNDELVVDGVTGLLTPARTVDGMAAAIRALLLDPQLRKEYGAAGRVRFEDNFTLAHMIEPTIELYHDVASGSAAAAVGANTDRFAKTA